MNKNVLILAILIIAAVGAGLYLTSALPQESPLSDEDAVRKVVTDFGSVLKNVSLTAPKEAAASAIEDNYKPFVSENLLNIWKEDPIKAPGRLTSSPWPDRIEISAVEREDDGAYSVGGNVIEVTSDNMESANRYGVSMKLRKTDGVWRITGFAKAILGE